MGEIDEKKLQEIVAEAVSIGIKESLKQTQIVGCCSERCMEKCGFTPFEHAKKHQKVDQLIETVDSAGNNVKTTIARTITVFLIGTVGIGTVFVIYEFIQKISKIAGK